MPYCEFYGLRLQNLELTVTRFREACARGDLGAWRKFYAMTEAARPMARLGREFEVYAPVSQIGVGSSRLVPLSPDEIPAPDSRTLAMVLAELTVMSADVHLPGYDDRFNWTFGDGMNLQRKFPGEADRAVFDLFCRRLFLCQDPIPAPFEFLDLPDGYRALIHNDELKQMLAREAETRLFERAAASQGPDAISQIIGREVLRVRHFLDVIATSELALYYRVWAT